MTNCKMTFAIVVLLGVSSGVQSAEPLRVRVLTYNIHHAEGVDRKLDLARIARIIKSVSPDVVALQEVDRNARRTGKVDQPKSLAKLTGLHVVFERNIRFQGGDYGNAVLSRWKVKAHRNHALPNSKGGEQRGVLVVTLSPPNRDESLLFLCTHLDHRKNDGDRLASGKLINKLAAEQAKAPAILAGDLNATPESRVLKEFARLWTSATVKALPTVPVAKPTSQIDYILFRPQRRWKVIEVRVLKEAVASDHRAVFAILELR